MGSLRKCHAVVLLPVIGNLALVMIGLGVAAYNTHHEAKTWGGNIVSHDLMGYSIIAGVLAIVLVISGAWYAFGKAESEVSAAYASTTSLVAWAFALLAFGFACKLHGATAELSWGFMTLSAAAILLLLVESIYCILRHMVVATPTPTPTPSPSSSTSMMVGFSNWAFSCVIGFWRTKK